MTDPLQQAYAGVQHYAGDLPLLTPPLPLWLLKIAQRTGQFSPGLGNFTLGFERISSGLDYTPIQKS